MTNAWLEAREQRRRTYRAIIGLLCAPVAGTFAAVLTCLPILYLIGAVPAPVGPTSATLSFGLPLMASAFLGWPVAFLLGWPIHAELQQRGANRLLHYVGFGALLAVGTVVPVTLVMQNFHFAYVGGIATTAGAVGGLVFWFIRRPDSDTPPV